MPAIPKRSDEKMGHRTKAELGTIDRIEVGGPVRVPEPGEHWCDIARYAWEAYVSSPLNIYFTETDLTFGWVTCEAIHNAVRDGSAMKVAAAESMMRNALFNEAERRRVRIEIARAEPEPDAVAEKNVADFRARRRANG